MTDGIEAVLGALILVIALLVGVTLIDTLASGESGIDERITRDHALLGDAGTAVTFDEGQDGKGTNETVFKTTGFAVNLTGADDSFVESDSNFTISTDQNWTVSVWARADSEASAANMTAVSLNGRLLIWWNGSKGNFSAWYFDEASRDSFQVNVTDNGDQPGNFTNIVVQANGTHLRIFRNNTVGDVKDITGSGISDAPVNATNWNGRIEELRTFDEVLNNSTRQELVDTPIEQQPTVSPTARVMFDQPDRDTQLILYASAALTESNVSYSDGFAAQEMTRAGIVQDNDYQWTDDGPKINPQSGGELDGAPVAYASYDFDTALADTIGAWADVVKVAALIPVLLISLVILSRLRGV